jgi:hypothetical protein
MALCRPGILERNDRLMLQTDSAGCNEAVEAWSVARKRRVSQIVDESARVGGLDLCQLYTCM